MVLACEPRDVPPEPPPAPVAGEAAEPPQRDVLYALGGWLARDLAGVKIEEADLPAIDEGLWDALLRRPLRVDPREVGMAVQRFLQDRRAELADDERRAGAPFLAAARAEPGATRTPNGVIYLALREGAGAAPALTDRVKVHYQGTRRDGSVFDSTDARGGTPAVFGMRQVVPCWTEALQRMKVGGKARITCPSDLAYGDRGLPGSVLPGAPLRFEIELLEVLPEDARAKSEATP